VAVVSSQNPSTIGQSVTLTAAVVPNSATGSVQFLDGSKVLGSATVSSGSATLSLGSLGVGTHSITAVYAGDADDIGSTSPVLTQTVNKAASTVTLTSSLNPANSGQRVTFTATVAPGSATGSVQFLEGATQLGNVTINRGSASWGTTNLAVGAHSITAVYSGDAVTATSTSEVLTQTVAPLPPSRLNATAVSSSQINLTWSASPTNGVTYNVYASSAAGFTPSAGNRIATGVTSTGYSDHGLPASTTRYYLVTAQNSGVESSPSNQDSATTQPPLACHISYSVTTQWNSGFVAAVSIKNTGTSAINGWNLTWTWAGNQRITQASNANYTQSGANASLTNENWNSTIAPGATVNGIGFNASYSGSNPNPTAFYVNGTRCQ